MRSSGLEAALGDDDGRYHSYLGPRVRLLDRLEAATASARLRQKRPELEAEIR